MSATVATLEPSVRERLEKEADKIATREYIGHGVFGGVSSAKGGIVVNRKMFDFDAAKQKAMNYLLQVEESKKK